MVRACSLVYSVLACFLLVNYWGTGPSGSNAPSRSRLLKIKLRPEAASNKICGAAAEVAEDPVFSPGLVLNQKYVIEKVLGAGGQGVALQAWDIQDKRGVVIKYYRSGSSNSFNEIMGLGIIHRLGRQLNISKINDVFLYMGSPVTVSDLQGMPLRLKEQNDHPGSSFTVQSSLFILREALHQLEVAHARNVVHGDVGVTNILVDAELPEGVQLGEYLNNFTYSPKGSGLARPMVHVIDWGLARRPNAFNASTGSLNENMALPQRNAPELLLHMGSSYKSDVWRAGFVLTALLTGSRPLVPGKTRWRKSSKERPIDTVLDLTEHFGGCLPSSFAEGTSNEAFLAAIQQRRDSCLAKNASAAHNIRQYLQDKLPLMEAHTIPAVASLLQGMLAADPEERYSVQQVLLHPAMGIIGHVT